MSLPLRTACLAALGLVVPATRPTLAADTWVEVKSPHFTVAANTGEKKARQIAWQFEQVRSALEKGWPWANPRLDRPVVVIAAKDEETMRGLTPQYYERRGQEHYAALLRTGSDGHYVALRADVEEEGQGLQPYRLAYWSYCEIVLGRTFRYGLPLWLSRGMAAVISNTIVNDKDVHFGRPLPYMVEQVRSGALMSVPQIIEVTPQGWNALSADERGRYDAQSWALVQFLIFGDPKSRMNAISSLVLRGVTSQEAIQQTFGGIAALDEAYRLYVHQGAFKFGRVLVNAEVPADKYPSRVMPGAEAAATRAAFLTASNRPVEARASLAESKATAPTLALPYAVEAQLLARENNREAERAALEKAVELKSGNYYAYYRLATLVGTATPETRAQALQYAERAVELNDQFAPSYGYLANAMLLANDDRAVNVLTKVIALEPSEITYRLQLSSALTRFGRHDEAIRVAREALPFARNEPERVRLQQVIDTATRLGAQPAGRSGALP